MAEEKNKPYRVLARKYRPRNFDELIGQDALVRTLKNAIESGRIAHAFMLTGIRGTGKTTTARIIAKALNYTGADGKAGPTTDSTDDCKVCQAITEDRHPDVMEMDAASRTGVDDIREIIDGVRYAPTGARYKIYIIDEVHMLSKNAFNALLKTLEEPPEHVIFIFATTEIRKVPVTVLSRCQRFDLRRVDVPVLSAHYKNICEQENVTIEDAALALIARAADGSVRDGMSLLDQAIALAGENITMTLVKDMLGLADSAQVLDMLEHAVKGECPEALALMDSLYKNGASPTVLMQDCLDFVHVITKLRAMPDLQEMHGAIAPDTMARCKELAASLSMPTLGRAWQIILKGLQEVSTAPNPQAAAEMIVIRLSYAADLPDPADLLRRLKDDQSGAVADSAPVTPSRPDPAPAERTPEPVAVRSGGGASAAAMPSTVAEPQAAVQVQESLETLQDVVAFLEEQKEVVLAGHVFLYVHLVKMKRGHIEMRPAENAPQKLSQDLRTALIRLTDEQWMVSISGSAGQPTLAEQAAEAYRQLEAETREHPVVKKVLEFFPDSELKVTDSI